MLTHAIKALEAAGFVFKVEGPSGRYAEHACGTVVVVRWSGAVEVLGGRI